LCAIEAPGVIIDIMSVHVVCTSCGSRFKAPDRAAGKSVFCLKCHTRIAVPAPPEAEPLLLETAAEAIPLEVADDSADQRPYTLLTAFLIIGAGVAFLLVIVLLVVVINRQPAAIAHAGQFNNVAIPNDFDPANPQFAAPIEHEPKPPLAAQQPERAERLAQLESRAQALLPPLQMQLEKHKQTLERLSKEEIAVFPKGKIGPGLLAKLNARYNVFLKDQTAAVKPCVKDVLAFQRQREEFLQAKRKIMFDQPASDDPKFEDYGGLLLTPDEIKDQGPRALNASSPRAAAGQHLQAAEKAGTFQGASYAGTHQDPGDADFAAVSFRAASYRGKSDVPVHVFVYRWRGAWSVLELPGRANSVLVGPPPADFKRTDAGW
jgi:hypothetical protein